MGRGGQLRMGGRWIVGKSVCVLFFVNTSLSRSLSAPLCLAVCVFVSPSLFLSFIIIIHSFYIALFSALEQTHCAHWHVILNE